MNIRLYALLIITLAGTASYPAVSEFDGFIKGYSSVRCIKGTINQYVYSGASVEKFSGDYSAVSEGWFRIDYTYPEKQTVISNSNGLYWYYPDRELLFVQYRDRNFAGVTSSIPGNPLIREFSGVKIVYEGIRFYGLLKYAHVYSFKTEAGDNSVYIWFEPGRKYVVRKYIKDSSGREIMKEVYHKHFTDGRVYIPSVIELFMRSGSGVVHTLTEYKNLNINSSPDKRLFEFSIKKNMTVRGFNEEKQ